MRSRMLLLAAAGTLAAGLVAGHAAGGSRAQLAFSKIVDGLSSPVYVTTAPGDPTTLYVVEQAGKIVTVEDGAVTGTFLDIRGRVRSGGEQGLLSMAFDPGYVQNKLFYVNYTDRNGDTRVVQLRAGSGGAGKQILFVRQPYSNHNGGQLQFDRLGYLYVGMGDGGSAGDPENRAQNLSSKLGKLLRCSPARGSCQVVGFGLRNPWRFSFDRQTGDLWIGDVGQGKMEEIDFRAEARIGRLANYGWPRYEGRSTYDARKRLVRKGDLVFPATQYTHRDGCSLTGGYVYRGSAAPEARGRYFFGDYCSGKLWSFVRGSAPVLLGTNIPSLSSFGEDGNGELYAVSTDGGLYGLRG